MFVYYRARDFRRSAELQAEQNERNQQAILRLLDELSSLADGNLTVQATVTEDITGAIAAPSTTRSTRCASSSPRSTSPRSRRRRREADRGHGAASRPRGGDTVEAGSGRLRIDGAHGQLDRGGLGQRRALLRRRAPLGRDRAQGRRGRAAHDRRHEPFSETIQDASKRIKRLGKSSQEWATSSS